MTIAFGSTSLITTLNWSSANFASGRGATILGWNVSNLSNSVAAAAAGLVITSWETHLRALTDNSCRLDTVTWETELYSGIITVGLDGSVNVVGPPSNTCVLTLKKGALKGPRNKGRNFWPGMVGEAQVDERGLIIPAHVAALQDGFNDFVASLLVSSPSLEPSIPQGDNPGDISQPIIPWPTTGDWSVASIIGTQRRRVRR